MLSDISATGWLVILSAMALGFGLMHFLIVAMKDKFENAASTPQETFGGRTEGEGRDERSGQNADSSSEKRSESAGPSKDWYEVLGVPANASPDQIRTAYRRKMALYHPDKVSALGPEFSVIAERMTKEINAAYENGIGAR